MKKRRVEFPVILYTRNKIIDGQHKELIEAVNTLYEAIEAGKGEESAKEALDFLMQYTVFHFGGEEKLWEENKYPGYEEHKAAHDAFVERVRQLYAELETMGATDAFAEKVEKEITDWLINHIMGLDMKAIEWLNTRSGYQMDNLM